MNGVAALDRRDGPGGSPGSTADLLDFPLAELRRPRGVRCAVPDIFADALPTGRAGKISFGVRVPGVAPTPRRAGRLRSRPVTEMAAVPETFRQAVAAMAAPAERTGVAVSEVRPPKRLAPWAYAVAAEANGPADELATARLVLLHDPDEPDSWNGVLRLVVYLRAELDPELAADPLLPGVGWSWLTDALHEAGAAADRLGGTVTLTSSARFGDIAGPPRSHDLELRGSWTPGGEDLGAHAIAFQELLASAAGLPPEGVSLLNQRAGGAAPR